MLLAVPRRRTNGLVHVVVELAEVCAASWSLETHILNDRFDFLVSSFR